MNARGLRWCRSGWVGAARLGQAAWFFGILYEGLVGMPQLLADARPRRASGLFAPGSPVRLEFSRWWQLILAFGATPVALLQYWQSGGNRRLVITNAASLACAAALSAYLIRSVNLCLLTSDKLLSERDLQKMIATWHTVNGARLGALAVAIASLPGVTSRDPQLST